MPRLPHLRMAALIRVCGLILANPWVRTEAGEARAQVRHYYGQRLLTRVFWGKVFSGQFDVAASLAAWCLR